MINFVFVNDIFSMRFAKNRPTTIEKPCHERKPYWAHADGVGGSCERGTERKPKPPSTVDGSGRHMVNEALVR